MVRLRLGAVVYALHERWQNNRVGYFASLRVGFKCWGRLFITKLIADLAIGIGTLFFLIPGIVLALRYALIAMPVVLEARSGADARYRSDELMEGRKLSLLFFAVIFYATLITAMLALYEAVSFVYLSTPMTDFRYYAAATVVDCVVDLLELPVICVLFFVHIQASNAVPSLAEEPTPEDALGISRPLPEDDGNPYLPPRTL